MKNTWITLLVLSFTLSAWANPAYTIRIDKQVATQQRAPFQLGTAVNPAGNTIRFNSQSMLVDGRPVLPVMGEIHYSRLPETEWRNELLKMKAGGINIVATYVFWIHHEEEEGQFDWTGQRNLRQFIETCHEVGLPLIMRLGPWCHGEVRNGGIPDWMVNSGIKLRNNNPEYLAKAKTLYGEIGRQAAGLLWKDGGPVVGVQLDNEFRGPGEHLMKLKEIAIEAGFDVPLYTRTGWPALSSPIPYGEILPLYGDYADGFWDRSTEEMPGNYWKSFIFRSFRSSTVIATEQLPPQSDQNNPDDMGYPFLTCELGGGMMTSYHRRIAIDPMDTYAMALAKVGSGSNLPGYYMYHGGTNPEGKLTSLNEMQNSLMTNHNDLPVKSYDFQTQLGEFGQMNPHYHMTRRLHLFLADFGSELTAMSPVFPEITEEQMKNDELLKWAVRSNGESGYVFVSNYQRLKPLSPKENVQFTLDLADGDLLLPEKPFTMPSGEAFFMPFNLDLGAARLVYSTTQPQAKLVDGDEGVFVFAENPGVEPEFVFEAKGVKVLSSNVKPRTENGRLYFNKVKSGTDAAIRLRDENRKTITIVLLDMETSLALWKGELAGKERLFITRSGLTCLGNQLELTDTPGQSLSLSVYPKPNKVADAQTTRKGKRNGLFTRYTIPLPGQPQLRVGLESVRKEDPNIREIRKGRSHVAEQPSDDDFAKAAVWKVVLPKETDSSRDIFLRFPYTGDVARIYLDGRLLTDNFYNGRSFLLGLKRYAPEIYRNELTIEILPLSKDLSMIYLPVKQDFSGKDYHLNLPRVDVEEKATVQLKVE
ncbi:beta-galactosidase [Bacteroidales bacterium OttesenSCG-928-L03]|nr:beta-galactosidase [Bacteroidales bacterium OttesenSCG-928-L03]